MKTSPKLWVWVGSPDDNLDVRRYVRATDEDIMLQLLVVERVDQLRARLRETAEILIAEIGADGPKNAEDMAREAVQLIQRLKGEEAPRGLIDPVEMMKTVEKSQNKLPSEAFREAREKGAAAVREEPTYRKYNVCPDIDTCLHYSPEAPDDTRCVLGSLTSLSGCGVADMKTIEEERDPLQCWSYHKDKACAMQTETPEEGCKQTGKACPGWADGTGMKGFFGEEKPSC